MSGSGLPGGCYFLTCAFLAAGLLLTTASAASLGWGHIEGEGVQVRGFSSQDSHITSC